MTILHKRLTFGSSTKGVRLLVGRKKLCVAKINEDRVAPFVQHDVLGFQVPVDNILTVHIPQSVGDASNIEPT